MDRRHKKSGKELNPETLALGYGYDPFLSEGAVKPPVFLTSTFQFKTAEEGQRYFELAYKLKPPRASEVPGLIYSRLNNPNLEIFERRVAAWDGTEEGAVFASGMAAITTLAWALLKPGDVVLSTQPIYGGTHYFFEHILPAFQITCRYVSAQTDVAEGLRQAAAEVGPNRVRMVFVETPANPSNVLVDLSAVADAVKEIRATGGNACHFAVDNTFLGPVFQRPAKFGADLVIYSATKFLGGHSDLIAGVVTGHSSTLEAVKLYRTILGTMANPFTGWLLLRSLETVSVRMRRQAKSAQKLAHLLAEHPKVQRVYYPGLLTPGTKEYAIYERQCTGPGSLIAFEVAGGVAGAQRVLNHFEIARLAVSLGGTESLVEHPMTMTHSDVPPEELDRIGVSPGLIRMSVGLEHLSDLKRDLQDALDAL
jgi:methionine-gamma-lyase